MLAQDEVELSQSKIKREETHQEKLESRRYHILACTSYGTDWIANLYFVPHHYFYAVAG
tara:strand:- start:1358 stop:1534 length:177 start_codon:yes stop_codon:yes gene_type:complete